MEYRSRFQALHASLLAIYRSRKRQTSSLDRYSVIDPTRISMNHFLSNESPIIDEFGNV